MADSKAGSPRLTMAIWVHLSAQGVWVARMPIVHYSIHVDLPRLVLDRFGRVIGPLPTRREATVAEISAFVADAGVTFVKLAARYVLMVTHDEDLIVGDKTRWYEPDAPA